MKVFVCIKQVPDTETKIKVAADAKSIDTTAIKWVMNPYDEYAVEEAVKMKETNPSAQVFVISAGPKKRVSESLRTALAMGADEAIVIDAPEAIDSYVTASLLAKEITAAGGADLILSGKVAIDDNASAVPQMLAEFLSLPHTSVVSKMTKSEGSLLVERDVEGGAKEVVQLNLPAVISANKGLNNPRYASLPGIMKAKKKVIKEVDGRSLGVDLTEKLKVLSVSLPPEKPAAKLFVGDSSQQVTDLVLALRNEAKVI